MKIDLHCHTEYSSDCATPISLIPARCQSTGIRVQAITDHNEIEGARLLKQRVEDTMDPQDLTIIVGEEVSTTEGEIIGLFLVEQIPAGLSPEDTVKAIKEQGGLVVLPHGFDPLKRFRLKPTALERVIDEIDIIETFNARISNLKWNQAAVEWAQAHGVLMSAGTDAHRLSDIGTAWAEVPYRSIHHPEQLLDALKDGVPAGIWVHPALAFLYKSWDRTLRRLKLRK
ncbi:MAG: PHP domain-containing protein [Chloroflexi bacterium]|nr:MAG: PHP domain-containing protein [Chloroflexota bacterium]